MNDSLDTIEFWHDDVVEISDDIEIWNGDLDLPDCFLGEMSLHLWLFLYSEWDRNWDLTHGSFGEVCLHLWLCLCSESDRDHDCDLSCGSFGEVSHTFVIASLQWTGLCSHTLLLCRSVSMFASFSPSWTGWWLRLWSLTCFFWGSVWTFVTVFHECTDDRDSDLGWCFVCTISDEWNPEYMWLWLPLAFECDGVHDL